MAGIIQTNLHKDDLGRLSGPFISIPKNPGYGWWPARVNSNMTVQKQLSTIKPSEESRILNYALSLLTS